MPWKRKVRTKSKLNYAKLKFKVAILQLSNAKLKAAVTKLSDVADNFAAVTKWSSAFAYSNFAVCGFFAAGQFAVGQFGVKKMLVLVRLG